jgi:hypothetical protein
MANFSRDMLRLTGFVVICGESFVEYISSSKKARLLDKETGCSDCLYEWPYRPERVVLRVYRKILVEALQVHEDLMMVMSSWRAAGVTPSRVKIA